MWIKFSMWLKYKIDLLLSKGTFFLVLMLFLSTFLFVLVVSIVALILQSNWAKGSLLFAFWKTIQLTLDAGNLSNIEGNAPLLISMAMVTLFGLFFTSMLISIINSGLEHRIDDFKKGTSKVIVSNHTVILGYQESIFTIISELIVANENQKKATIVVLSKVPKQQMEDEIKTRVPKSKKTSIIVRNGSTCDFEDLNKCSVENCKSVIIIEENDFSVIKSLIAVSSILDFNKDCSLYNPHISAIIYEKCNLEVARLAGKEYAEILHFSDAISRIMANTCCQPGISKVFTELFNFDGDEIYFSKNPFKSAIKFSDAIEQFENCTVIGVKKGNLTKINPDKNMIIELSDQIILLAADDYDYQIRKPEFQYLTDVFIENPKIENRENEKLLILGNNELLEKIIEELDYYLSEGSVITLADKDENGYSKFNTNRYRNLKVNIIQEDIYSRKTIEKLISKGYKHVLILSDKSEGTEFADSRTLLILMYLRDISLRSQLNFSITSEMLSIKNQELAKIADVSDFVISSNITSLILSQISENRLLAPVFADLLDSDGSEIYMKNASDYVKINSKIQIHSLVCYFSQRNQIFIGYKTDRIENGEHKIDIITNPRKSDFVTFMAEDKIILISEE